MRKKNNTLVLESKEDEELLYDYCDSYLFWLNDDFDDEDMLENSHKIYKQIINKVGRISLIKIQNIIYAFADKDELFIKLWPKILKCLELADLVKVVY